MNYAGHKKLRADVAEVANTMCDLRARLNDMEHRCRFDSDVLVERLARQTLYRAALQSGRRYIGIELLEQYHRAGQQRLAAVQRAMQQGAANDDWFMPEAA